MTKTGARVRCEQQVLAVLENARASLWTLEQFQLALRERRRLLIARHGRPSVNGWYAAVRTLCSVRVRRLSDLRQLPLPLEM